VLEPHSSRSKDRAEPFQAGAKNRLRLSSRLAELSRLAALSLAVGNTTIDGHVTGTAQPSTVRSVGQVGV